ncbi:MAG: SdpI family protein [Lachnospiraceae bacterium]|nr:SdpI family protein [Lachnospiraceae bacterium]
MKKIMWIAAMIPVVVTSIVLQFMPDTIPMHHDLAGNTDRWGSKTESLILPVIILVITLFWHLMICAFEKKELNAKTEKEQMEAKSSARVLGIVGITQAIMFGIMHYFILYSSWMQANTGGTKTTIDIAKVSCILCGIMLVVLGNFLTKAKKNAVMGVRTVWSMYNDNTWRKSNRFGAICIIIAGLLTIITTAFTNGMTGTIFLLVYILIAAVIAVVYSKRVYDQEKS